MAALCKNVQSLSSLGKIVRCVFPLASQRRFIRRDPEEEFERFKISGTFEEKVRKPLREAREISRDITPVVKVVDDAASSSSSSPPSASITRYSRRRIRRKGSQQLEKENDLVTRDVSLEQAHEDFISSAAGIEYTVRIGKHYNIFTNLFQDNVHFTPNVSLKLKIAYEPQEDQALVCPVYYGNKMELDDVQQPPLVGFVGEKNQLYSLFLVNLDGHLTEKNSEYLHWYAVNMDADEGLPSATTCPYLPPIPYKGTGFHRYVFIMLQHSGRIALNELPSISASSLSSRTFSFAKFYNQSQEKTTPVGLQFFQCEWSELVTQTLYQTLDMKEPTFIYDYPEKRYISQKRWPHKQPFQTYVSRTSIEFFSVGKESNNGAFSNNYLDRHRDRKDLKEEVLVEHLQEISPFFPPDHGKPKYPLSTPTQKGLYRDALPPTWIKNTQRNKALGIHKYKYVNSD